MIIWQILLVLFMTSKGITRNLTDALESYTRLVRLPQNSPMSHVLQICRTWRKSRPMQLKSCMRGKGSANCRCQLFTCRKFVLNLSCSCRLCILTWLRRKSYVWYMNMPFFTPINLLRICLPSVLTSVSIFLENLELNNTGSLKLNFCLYKGKAQSCGCATHASTRQTTQRNCTTRAT